MKWTGLLKFFRPREYERRVNAARRYEWRRDCDRARLAGEPPPGPPNWITVR